MFLVGIMALILIPPCVLTAVFLVPEKLNIAPVKNDMLPRQAIMWSNKPFRRLVIAFICYSGSAALIAPLFVMLVIHIIEDPTAGAKVVLGYFAGNLVGIPLWIWVAEKTDKHIRWLLSILLMVIVYPQYFFWPGAGDLVLAMGLNFMLGLGGGNINVVPASMKADVIDLDTLESGQDRAGLFFAAWSTATKKVTASYLAILLFPWPGR